MGRDPPDDETKREPPLEDERAAPFDEEKLLEDLRSRDEDLARKAMSRLIEHYGPALDRFLRRRLPLHAVDDVWQTVWIQTWEKASQPPLGKLLFTIARRRCADHHRDRSRRGAHAGTRRNPDEDAGEVPSAEAMGIEIEEEKEREEMEKRLHEALARLEPAARQAISLRCLLGWEVNDIAEKLGKTPNAVSIMLHRARKELKGLLLDEDLMKAVGAPTGEEQ